MDARSAHVRGPHYQLTDAIANPKPVQQPYPPLWIGGRGERKTLRVGRRARRRLERAGGDPDEVARLSGVAGRHCGDVGRDPAEIRRSVQVRYAGDDEALLRTAAAYAARGVRDLIVIVPPGDAERHAEAVAGLLPRLRAARLRRYG